jgi:hypothetical protein
MNWFKQPFARRYRYSELSETIRQHLEEKIADLMGSGMTRSEPPVLNSVIVADN